MPGKTATVIVRSGTSVFVGTVHGNTEEPDPKKLAVSRVADTDHLVLRNVRLIVTNYVPMQTRQGVQVIKSVQLVSPDYEVTPLKELFLKVDNFYFASESAEKELEAAAEAADDAEERERVRRETGIET